ncbi:MAG TPA: ABC transporter permease [Acidobacteriaceae bacterium]|nr:ABC transporter permease [Acidobacteriaceae bacterium]
MSKIRTLWSKVKGQALQAREDEAFDEEVREHIALLERRYQAQGMSAHEASKAALRQFGNVTFLKEKQREQRGVLSLAEWGRDVRFGMRMLTKRPALNAAMILALALGIGANTTVFSVVDAVLLRPLPYAHPERLVEVQSADEMAGFEGGSVSYPDFFDWRAQNHSFDHLVSYHDASLTLTGVQGALHLNGEVVSWDLLPLLGVSPELGRGFRPEEEKAGARVVLLSHALWASQFGSERSIVGQTIHLSGDAYTIAGVMPATFQFPVDAPQISFWTTLAVDNNGTTQAQTANRGDHEMSVIGRLKPGVTLAQADADMTAIAARLAKQYPDTNIRHNSARVEGELRAKLGDTRTLLLLILGAVGLVLLIACGNVGNLLLVRARERERELAMRAALGANRARLVRQLLVESVMIGVLGGAAGCALAFLSTPAVLRLIGDSVPRAVDAGVNLPVLGFALAISVLSGLMFGLVPAITSARGDLLSPLKEGGRSDTGGQHQLGSVVIAGQVALGILLTASAGLLVTSFIHLTHTNQGFNPDHVLTLLFETPESRYANTRAEFYREYFEKLRALPGVQSAAGSILLPMTDNSAHVSFENPEHPLPKGQLESAMVDLVSPGYFQTMEMPLFAGRDFSDSDTLQSQQVMIVNQAFAAKFFPGEVALGKKLKPGFSNGPSQPPAWRTIVGVVGNIRTVATQRETDPMYYLPASQLPGACCMYTVARTSMDPLALEPEVRSLLASMDPDIPISDVRTMHDRIGLELAQPRFAMVLLAAFAGLALVLTLVGLYGIMAYSVARRTREIGVRLALGATRPMVLQMVLRQAAVLILIGSGLGIAGALASGSMLRAFLYGTGARNPVVLASVWVLVGVTGLLAAYLPARKAMRVDPSMALRCE